MKHFSNEFCEMQLYDQFVVLTINENIDLTLEKASIIRDKLTKFYKSKDFIMISNRKHKHNVSPQIYKEGQLSNMKGLAIVSTDNEERGKAEIEQSMYGRSFAFFTCLEEAKSWAEGYF
ncbi:hypothetical protein U6A24_21970 [Aquimarina gracilis]|uniref:SpoIIAA-like protein n=1 Tax=Aquimarina gracilis TaxID=874422 RepID=A0ABU6A1X5_9FLAO|nr:hypothetical protein [Aquimarina gracilis]MEB3348160.1 hypothetical protein [Aquimarina gracilis]